MHAVAALNTIMGRWGLKASSEWNISGEPCSGFASDATDWDHQRNINPFISASAPTTTTPSATSPGCTYTLLSPPWMQFLKEFMPDLS
ncbi:hypothetical protein GUJ93_ZPchr0005g15325 [Zizania palustris]|uniref:Uncharacterized protein n=1 Tax=Zizania palustris TaxID=103762 RepID=A0A8J5SKW3_ZIZPA|nr:hypothetical protein GUJ93_ZPchr0005g15325 [Zizania palustris]